MRTVVQTPDAPKAIGPYSQAITFGNLVFTSGQIPLDPATGLLVGGDISDATRRVMENLRAVLAAAGCDFSHVVKTTIFLQDLADFTGMNEVYGTYFPSSPPARSTVQVAALPKAARVEIEMLAVKA